MEPRKSSEDSLLTLAFSVHSNRGGYALLIGAGVSSSSGLPTAWEVLTDLIRRVGELTDSQVGEPTSWYRDRFDEEALYSNVLRRLAPTQLERQRMLRQYFERSEGALDEERRGPTVAHRSIARLVRTGTVRLIVTLNFDRLVEEALREEGIEPTVVSTSAEIAGLQPLHNVNCCVIHLHGDYLNPTSMLNTDDELSGYPPETSALIQRILEEYGLIIAGWSAEHDHALRDLISRHYPGRSTLAWIEPGELGELGTDLLLRTQGLLIQENADQGFGWLADSVEALDRRRSRHPFTVATAIETAKRELSGDWVAINLHDRLGRELAALAENEVLQIQDPGSAEPYGGYDGVVETIEEATRISAALIATLAYWGDSTTDDWWVDQLERFGQSTRASGEVRFLSTRTIAGSILFYAAGVAAVAAARSDLIWRLIGLRREDPYSRGPDFLADVLASDSAYRHAATVGGPIRTVAPILQEVIPGGMDSVESAWQTFEILRLTNVVIRRPGFSAMSESINALDLRLRNLTRKDDEEEIAKIQIQRRDLIRGFAERLRIGRPHLYVVDVSLEDDYRNPEGLRLNRNLATEGNSHPLVAYMDEPNAPQLRVAIECLQQALSGLADHLAWNGRSTSMGFVDQELWLDGQGTITTILTETS